MPITEWSEHIVIAQLDDEPQFSEDFNAIFRLLEARGDDPPHIIADMTAVTYLNSSNIAQLLRLRKLLQAKDRRLRLCSVCDQVWSVILITGLDKLFEFTDDVSTSLAALQLGL
jgi:anti-anti-sigma factor